VCIALRAGTSASAAARACSFYCNGAPQPVPSAVTITDTLVGRTVEAGIDWKFAGGWRARAEHRYSNFGKYQLRISAWNDDHQQHIPVQPAQRELHRQLPHLIPVWWSGRRKALSSPKTNDSKPRLRPGLSVCRPPQACPSQQQPRISSL
jgi:hypothetical protein